MLLKELIVVVKDGFKETNSRLCSVDAKLGSIDAKLDTVATKLDLIVDTQEKIVHKIDVARKKIVSEVKGLRHDLKGRMGGRPQRKRAQIDIA